MAEMDEIAKLLGFGPALAYAGATYGLFRWVDARASSEAMAALEGVIKIKDYDKRKLAAALVEVFDRIYTRPLLHWRAFVRSLLFTVVVSIAYFFEIEGLPNTGNTPTVVVVATVGFILLLGLPSLLLNIATDYLSLFAIRWWLVTVGVRPIFALISAAMLGIAIIECSVLARILVWGGWYPGSVGRMWFILSYLPYLTFSPSYFAIPAMVVFAWLPLFGISIVVLRTIQPISWSVTKMRWFLKDGKEHPLDAVGYVAGMIVFVIVAVWQFVFKGTA